MLTSSFSSSSHTSQARFLETSESVREIKTTGEEKPPDRGESVNKDDLWAARLTASLSVSSAFSVFVF